MSYIFMLIGLALVFVNIYLALIVNIVALVISIINLKKKDFLNIITLILSIIVIILCIIQIFMTNFNKTVDKVDKEMDSAKKNTYLTYEQKLENLAKEYVIEDQMINGMMYTGKSYIQINKLDNENTNGCDGYVMYDYDINEYQAYIKCPDYQTEGYDVNHDK